MNNLMLMHFDDPQCTGTLDKNDPMVHFTGYGTKSTGEVIDLYLKIDAHSVIQAMAYEVYGDPYTISALSYLSEQLRGKSIRACTLDMPQLIERLNVPKVKHHCLFAIQSAFNGLTNKYLEQEKPCKTMN